MNWSLWLIFLGDRDRVSPLLGRLRHEVCGGGVVSLPADGQRDQPLGDGRREAEAEAEGDLGDGDAEDGHSLLLLLFLLLRFLPQEDENLQGCPSGRGHFFVHIKSNVASQSKWKCYCCTTYILMSINE